MGCWNTPRPCASVQTTQHSDVISYHGPIISVFRRNSKVGSGDRSCVRIDFFKAVLGIFNSTPLFMFPADRRGGARDPSQAGLLENIKKEKRV